MMRLLLALCSTIAPALALAGCIGNVYGTTGPTPPPPNHTRLIVANFATGGTTSNVVAYTYPLNNSSAPTSIVPGSASGPNGATGLIEDGLGDVFVANEDANSVIGYLPIIGSSSTPALTLVNGISKPQDMTLDPFNLYVANFSSVAIPTGSITAYPQPLANTSVPLYAITLGLNGPTSVTFNGSNALFVANKTGGNVAIYSLPASHSSAPAATLSTGLSTPVAVAFDGSGNLYVVDNTANKVDVYTGSLVGNPAPTFAITNGISSPRYISFDSQGGLYVSNAGSITAYAPPFSASSSPVVTITTGLNVPVGLTVGI